MTKNKYNYYYLQKMEFCYVGNPNKSANKLLTWKTRFLLCTGYKINKILCLSIYKQKIICLPIYKPKLEIWKDTILCQTYQKYQITRK